MNRFILTIIVLMFPFTAFAAHDCGQLVRSGRTYNWCIDAQDGSTNGDVLFAFHGAGDDETMWATGVHGRAITAGLKNRIGDLPTVISVSLGRWWLATDLRGPDDTPSITDELLNSVLPELESKIPTPVKHHFILGLSMGSFNAVQLFFRATSRFDRLVLMCAAIQTIGAFSDPSAIQHAIDEHPFIRPDDYRGFLEWQERTFQTPDVWLRHNPLAWIGAAAASTPPIYITVGHEDEFGFYDGAEEFARVGVMRGLNVKWKPLTGGHCAYDPNDIAAFLYP